MNNSGTKFYMLGMMEKDGEYEAPYLGDFADLYNSLEEAQKAAIVEREYINHKDEIVIFEITKIYVNRYPKESKKIWMELE